MFSIGFETVGCSFFLGGGGGVCWWLGSWSQVNFVLVVLKIDMFLCNISAGVKHTID